MLALRASSQGNLYFPEYRKISDGCLLISISEVLVCPTGYPFLSAVVNWLSHVDNCFLSAVAE